MKIATTTWFNKQDYLADNFCNLNYGAPQNVRRLGKPKDVGCRLAQYPKARDPKTSYGEQAFVVGDGETGLTSRILPVPGLIENPLDTMERRIAKNILRMKAKRGSKEYIKHMRMQRLSHGQHHKNNNRNSDFGTGTNLQSGTRAFDPSTSARFDVHNSRFDTQSLSSEVDLAATLPNPNLSKLRLGETIPNHDGVIPRTSFSSAHR